MQDDNRDLDDILTILGTGKWNIIIFLLASFSGMRIPPIVLSASFSAPALNYTCISPYEGESFYNDSLHHPKPESLQCYNELTSEYCTDWNYDTSVFETTITSQYDLVCGEAYQRSTYSSIYMFGSLCGASVVGFLADWKGRKLALSIGLIGFTIVPTLMSWVPSLTFVMICRLVEGFLHTLTISAFYTLALEVCEPKHRATVGIWLALPWALGTIAWGGLGYLIRDWRWLNFVAGIPSILCLPCVWLIEESPRWLVVNGHHDRAVTMLQKAARINKATLPSEEQLREIMIRTQKNSSKTTISEKSESDGKLKKFIQTFGLLFSTHELRKRCFVMFYLFFVCSTVFYGLSLSAVTLSADPFIYMAIGGLMEVPSYSVSSVVISHWGRKIPTALSFLICGVTILALAFTPNDITWLVITLAMIGKLTISMAYQVVYLYIIELLPTETRFQGLGAAMLVSRIGSIISPYITDYLGTSTYWWLPSAIFGTLSLAGGFLTLILPETKGKSMPDTVNEMEGQNISELSSSMKEHGLKDLKEAQIELDQDVEEKECTEKGN